MELVYTQDQLADVAHRILDVINTKTICFHGSMGAGKTTLIKALVKHLGGAQSGNSPTFGIVNEYSNKNGSLLGYHFDFYRIEDEIEALDIGLEDYFAQDTWLFIEWPEKITSLIPPDSSHVHIEILDPQTRKLNVQNNPQHVFL